MKTILLMESNNAIRENLAEGLEMEGYNIKIPFIFSTNMSEKKDRTLALGLGADDYIVKPYEFEPLFTMAETWIKSGSKRQKNTPDTIYLN